MRSKEKQRLAALKALRAMGTPTDAAMSRLIGFAGDLFDAPIAAVALVDDDRRWFKSNIAMTPCAADSDNTFCAYTVSMGPNTVIVVEDALLDPRFATSGWVTNAPNIRFYAGATLTTREGENFGTLCVVDNKPRARPSDSDLGRLKLLAQIMVDEFEQARSHQLAREKQLLLEIAEGMAAVGHWRLDLLTQSVTWSDAVYAIHGVARTGFDPVLDDALAFYHPDDRDVVLRHIQAAIETKTGFDFRLRIIRADGAVRHVISRGVCELADGGEARSLVGLFQDVTETVEVVLALEQSRQRYRLLTNTAGDILTRYDFAGNGFYSSPAVERILGHTMAEAASMTVSATLHPDDVSGVMAAFQEMAGGLEAKTIQHRSRHKNGGHIWLESNLQLVRDDSGAPKEIVCVSRDISDRKALELELVAARDDAREHVQRALLAEDIGGLGYWRYDIAAARFEASPKMFEIYGLPVMDTPDIETFTALFHPDDRQRLMDQMIARWEAGESDPNVLTRIVRPNGEERYLTRSSTIQMDADGAPVFMMGTVLDITEKHLAGAALAESEGRYRLLADNASDMIARSGPKGEIQFISPGCQHILGYAPDEMIGQRVSELTHPDDQSALVNHFNALRGGGLPEPCQFRGRHKDGHWVWLEGQPKLIFDETTDDLVAILDVVRDVTHRKALEAELVEARVEAEAAAAVKSEFLSNMSHELRTPLTAVLGFARLIEGQPELSSATRRFVDRVLNAGKALMSTINDILDFSKLEAGQVEIVVAPCDPRQVLTDALDLFSGQAQEKGVDLALIGADQLPTSLALASDRVRQILLNLLGNAVKFTDQGQVALEATYSAKTAILRLSVTDSGAGIPSDRLGQLFKRFSQVDGSSTRRHGGTGLGLAICKGLAEAMKGEIGASSRLGEGSCFWVEIPAPLVDVEDKAGLNAEAMSLPLGCRVLVTDDNAVNRDLVSVVLGVFGAEVVEAANGEDAIKIAAAQPFDIILMDLRMPGVGGEQAAAQIRDGGGPNRDIPIIAFSADATKAMPVDLFDGVVAKPLDASQLISEINRTLHEAIHAS